ncbi:MAG TPA: translation initiation factor IF-2 subunit gamma [Candidatus Bathyarchaeia archaeon]|nr:translation initiation factor IF-2 subunit gamma [Candidatus Bathyarchaeia archaeon]
MYCKLEAADLEACVNIGMVGHVDHGKTTLVSALSGVWTDQHSEEVKRGISIRLGYANVTFRKCPRCPEPDAYTVSEECAKCGGKAEVLRTVSFVDAPGHETLMATMLSGAAIMDGAILVIAANEPCPQPQTKEHLMALDIIGIKNVIIVQNKIDLVSHDELLTNYEQIKEFVKGTVAEHAPIVPISAQQAVNIDLLISLIENEIPCPAHDLTKPAQMFIARSFDVNKPGTDIAKLLGGVIGGTLNQGELRLKDELEIRPGRRTEASGKNEWIPITTSVASIVSEKEKLKVATPGGLLGIGTKLDPSLVKSDSLVGQIAGMPGTLPPVWRSFTMQVRLLDRVVGSSDELNVESIHTSEPLMLSVGTATTVGVTTSARNSAVEVALKRPVCAEIGSRIAISRRIGSRWRLIGAGTLIK